MKTLSRLKTINGLLADLPPLPAAIRYYDDFSDSYAQVTEPDQSYLWSIHSTGAAELLTSSILIRLFAGLSGAGVALHSVICHL